MPCAVAVKTSAMIMLVVIGAYVLNFVLTAAGVSRALQDLLNGLGLGPLATLLVIVLMYIILGFFIETLSLMVATIPIVVPIIVHLGYDKIWFGILMIILVEMALITPPVRSEPLRRPGRAQRQAVRRSHARLHSLRHRDAGHGRLVDPEPTACALSAIYPVRGSAMQFKTPAGTLECTPDTLIVAGWTGRDRAAVDHHIEELGSNRCTGAFDGAALLSVRGLPAYPAQVDPGAGQ